MSGFLSAVFYVVGALAFGVACIYWQQGSYRANWFALGWGSLGFILLGIGAAFSFYREVIEPSRQAQSLTPKERPYVFIKQALLAEPLKEGQKPVFTFIVANSGAIEAHGFVKDVTYAYTVNPKDEPFDYRVGEKLTFHLAPTAEVTGRAPLNIIITQERIDALANNAARLFVYARGEYGDEHGRTYPLDVCFVYNRDVWGNMSICQDDNVIKKQP